MEAWRNVWRNHIVPLLSDNHLEALRQLLNDDDPRLMQGATTSPPPLMAVADWPVEKACALTCCGWLGDGLETVSECEEFFAYTCAKIDQHMGEAAGCRWFLNWFDETPREQMVPALLAEVEKALAERMTAS